MNDYNIGTSPDKNELCSGIAYVIIPSDSDREKYITECYRTATVSVYNEHNGYLNRVPIDKFSLSNIKFPDRSDDFGSAVGVMIDMVQQKPFINGVYFNSDELSGLSENKFNFKSTSESNIVEISGSPKDGKIILNVNTNDVSGEIDIIVKNRNNGIGTVRINVDGNTEITSQNDTILRQFGALTMSTENPDDSGVFTNEMHTSEGRRIISKNEELHTDSYKINDGDQPFILGKLLKSFLKDLIKEISSSTVATAIGTQPLINAKQIAEYGTDEKIDKFLSTIGFINK